MSISFGMILFGSLLVVAGWKNVSLTALARGDNTTPKGTGGSAAAPSTVANGAAVTASGHPDEGTRGAK